eukprot:11085556-Alexandrium_andersonii.AAC.1
MPVELRAIQEFLSGGRYRALCTNREKGRAQGLPFFTPKSPPPPGRGPSPRAQGSRSESSAPSSRG